MKDDAQMPDVQLGLIGDNIAKSRAPVLHRLIGEQHGMAVAYDRLVPKDLGQDFDAVFESCPERGFRGINVTYPYKEKAAAKVRIDDPLVRAMGAVNTVVFESGEAMGYNTDYTGFIKAYRAVCGDRDPGIVCMIGTGGVGRAVAFGLVALGVTELRLVDRDADKARGLADDLRWAAPDVAVSVIADVAAAATGADGVINCTPVGMVGYEGTPLDRLSMRGASWAFDAVYTPVDTQFLTDAQQEGLTIISGYELFFYQGVDASWIFIGKPIDETALRKSLEKVD